jgi:hypothetical protein
VRFGSDRDGSIGADNVGSGAVEDIKTRSVRAYDADELERRHPTSMQAEYGRTTHTAEGSLKQRRVIGFKIRIDPATREPIQNVYITKSRET